MFVSALFPFILFTILHSASSIALKGPPLTRYEPCGLGLLYFDKSPTNQLWMGVLNFALKPELTAPNVELSFKVPIMFASTSQAGLFRTDNNANKITIRPKGKVPKRFIFLLQLQDDVVPRVKSFSINGEVLCNDFIRSQQTSKDELNNNDKPQHVCGRRSIEHTELSTVGEDAKSGQWPWHVAIFVKNADDPKKKTYFCGGSVISKTAILTAGHCVRRNGESFEPNRMIIYAGTANLSETKTGGFQNLKAKKIIIHPSYNETLATADLAIIKVDAFKFTEYVQPICIWGPVYERSQLFGIDATMIGFGQTEEDLYPQILRSIHTTIQSDATCLKYAPKLYPKLLNEFTFCAGYGPQSKINPRNGDSGGGLVLPVQQSDGKISWFVRGVLSKCGMDDGDNLCDPKYYVVYTDVPSHYNWIFHHSGLKYRSNILHV